MSAFLRWVEDLPALLQSGVNETFYDIQSNNYAPLPRAMTGRVNKACLADGTEVAHLKQQNAPGEQPGEVFTFYFRSARGRSEWAAFVDKVAALIAHDVQEATKGLSANFVMQRTNDDAFDTLADCAALRNGLLRIGAKARGKKAGVVLVADP